MEYILPFLQCKGIDIRCMHESPSISILLWTHIIKDQFFTKNGTRNKFRRPKILLNYAKTKTQAEFFKDCHLHRGHTYCSFKCCHQAYIQIKLPKYSHFQKTCRKSIVASLNVLQIQTRDEVIKLHNAPIKER